MFKKRFRINIGKYSFSNRVIDNWNRLNNDIVTAKSLNLFKGKLDSHLRIVAGLINISLRLFSARPADRLDEAPPLKKVNAGQPGKPEPRTWGDPGYSGGDESGNGAVGAKKVEMSLVCRTKVSRIENVHDVQ